MWRIALAIAVAGALPLWAAREAKVRPSGAPPAGAPVAAGENDADPGAAAGDNGGDSDYAAARLLQRADELLQAGEKERGIKMLESVVEQYPKSMMRHKAYLALGRHFLEARDQNQAIAYLARVRELEREPALSPELQDMLAESLYQTGVAYFQMRQYNAAFPVLRKIVAQFPNSVWANQSYYYIGMCHFMQENWSKAIEALSLVGTHVDPASPKTEFVEAGRRFYVKVQDADLPVLNRMGLEIKVVVESASGDRETVVCIPLAGTQNDVFVGSIPTQVGTPAPGDATLQVVGGDEIMVRYLDDNTQEGRKDVPREGKVRVVSTGGVYFSLGDFETRARHAFPGQPVFVVVEDADLDTSTSRDRASVRLLVRYRPEEDADEQPLAIGAGGFADLLTDRRDELTVRDELVINLDEIGAGDIVRSGRFGGSVKIEAATDGLQPDRADAVLHAREGDEILAIYNDARHGEGEFARESTYRVVVGGMVDTRPQASQSVVYDETLRARKNLVEANAFLELARIFKDMGLMQGATERAAEGLDRAQRVIGVQVAIPSNLKQEAFKLKWELHLVSDDYESAVAACQLFNQLFPDSPFVDQALLGIGRIRLQAKQYAEAIKVFNQILGLKTSLAKAEAQFRIAEATESDPLGGFEKAIPHYKLCADRYPDSEFAGRAMGKLIDYYIENRDYAQASAMLEQVFQDYPDAPFLDAMLLKWTLVAFRMGEFRKAHEKASELLFQYPGSSYAEKAREILPRIEEKL